MIENNLEQANVNYENIISKAGKRDFFESKELLEDELSVIRQEQTGKENISMAKNIDDIEYVTNEKVVEGAISYLNVEKDSKIIAISDIHGCSPDMDNAINEFFERKQARENVYFSFVGDVGTGAPQKIEVNEKLAALKNNFSKEMNIMSGNGDRRSVSLANGLLYEMTEKFTPELHSFLSERTNEIFERFKKEREIKTDEKNSLGIDYNSIYGAQLLRLAKESGAEPLEIDDLKVLYQTMKGGSGFDIKNKKDMSNVFTFNVLRQLVKSLEPVEKTLDRKDKLTDDKKLQKQSLEIFNYWKKQNEIYNEQPLFTFYDDGENVVVCTHSGVVKDLKKLGDLVNNIEYQTKSTWNKFLKGGASKYGDYDIYDEKDLGEFVGKIIPKNRNVIYVTGHNHGNYTKEFNILDNEGKDTGQKAVRAEICAGSIKNKDAKYAVVDFSKINNVKNTDSEIEFKDI